MTTRTRRHIRDLAPSEIVELARNQDNIQLRRALAKYVGTLIGDYEDEGKSIPAWLETAQFYLYGELQMLEKGII